jgi:hypothetical protein
MPKFELISIAEDGYESNRISCVHEEHFPNRQQLKLSVTSKKNLVIEASNPNNNRPATIINVFDIDVDGLIEFLKEAKTFISEEEMVRKLMGR